MYLQGGVDWKKAGGVRYLQNRESFLTQKNNMEEALLNLLKSFSPFEGGLKNCNEEECRGTEKSCMLYFVL